MTSNHPLPAAPGQQAAPTTRQRAKSSFSFRSNHSHKSTGSNGKIDLHETHEEKDSKRLHSKADPSMALAEAEPAAVARGETSLASLRTIQHRDSLGNPIADPDRSNPTRSRWERPLDTIRSFEAAIDGNYRKSYIRTDSGDAQSTYNRRSSYYGGTQITQDDRPRFPQNSYYGGRPQSYRPESTYMDGRYNNGMARPESYHNGGENAAGPSNGYHPNRARYPRTASEPHFNSSQVYPAPGIQQSYETVTTASGSGSSADPAGYSTDPSSENSSVDRVAPLPVKEVENYGFNGFGNNPQYAAPGSGLPEQPGPTGAARQGNGYQHQGPPPPPTKDNTGLKGPIKLGETSGNASPQPVQTPANEKRRSWLGRKLRK